MSGVVTVQYGYFCVSRVKSEWLQFESGEEFSCTWIWIVDEVCSLETSYSKHVELFPSPPQRAGSAAFPASCPSPAAGGERERATSPCATTTTTNMHL